MRFISIELRNIGVCRGAHHFDLSPLPSDGGGSRAVTIFYGRNGVGKSTIYKSVELALYGRLALGDRVTQKQYQDFIARCLEDRSSPIPETERTGSVAVDFEFLRSGKTVRVSVRRSWRLSGSSFTEELVAMEDGREPDLLDDDDRENVAQDLIFEYLPLELSDVCFFDTEQLDSLSSPEQHNRALGEMMRRLLGLGTVSKLRDDIGHYMDEYLRSHGGSKETLALCDVIVREQEQLEIIKAELESGRDQFRKLIDEKKAVSARLKRLERHLASQGGTYAEKRRQLQDALHNLEARRQQVQDSLAELCGGLLPFALVPELLSELADSLRKEAQNTQHRIAADFIRERQGHLLSQLDSSCFWAGVDLDVEGRGKLTERLREALETLAPGTEDPESGPVVHQVTDADRQRILEWMRASRMEVTSKAAGLCTELAKLKDRITKVRAEIERAPDDELLAPIHKEISSAEQELNVLQSKESELRGAMATLEYRVGEAERETRTKRDRLLKAQSADHNLDMAKRTRLVLRDYEGEILSRKAREIGAGVSEVFNLLCHKSDLLSSVRVDPSDFSVSLHTENGKHVELSELSAGERQLYVFSLLWALRRLSSRDLPLFVDTPIAKLDEGHGWKIVHEYLPKVSGQVVLFAHTKEMDKGLLDEAARYTARRYNLSYSNELGGTLSRTEDAAGTAASWHAVPGMVPE